jgi:outer membrane protein TolC
VETSLVRLRETRAARDGQAAVVASAQEQSDLARSRYASGLTSFLNVTIADAALAEAELGLAQADGAVLEAQILLANSLGLGADF